MFILVSPRFIKYFTPKNIAGISIFPFVIVENKNIKQNKTFINHEMIHIRQQLELLFVFFLIIYAIEFIILCIKYKNWSKAYNNISFEREAYQNESNYHYLKTKKFFSFINYW